MYGNVEFGFFLYRGRGSSIEIVREKRCAADHFSQPKPYVISAWAKKTGIIQELIFGSHTIKQVDAFNLKS